MVKNADGSPAAVCSVILFSVDAASWKLPLSRRVAVARTDDKGALRVLGLPSGDYLAVALRDFDSRMWADPERLERLRPFSTPFTVVEGTGAEIKLEVKR
jgi:hypothetical protein